MQFFKSFFFTLALLFCMPVHTELLGIVAARSANIAHASALSVEAGFNWYTRQLQWSSVRINYKPVKDFQVYVDAARLQATNLPVNATRTANFGGSGFGGGFIVSLPKLFARIDLAFKASYHAAVVDSAGTFDNTGSNAGRSRYALRQTQHSADIVISPIDPLFENGVTWYGTLGYVVTNGRLTFSAVQVATGGVSLDVEREGIDYRAKAGTAVGLGLIKPKGRGRVFVGLKVLAGDPLLGVGFRFDLR